jgi:hypothetical protein
MTLTSGEVNWVEIDGGKDAEDLDHLIPPQERLHLDAISVLLWDFGEGSVLCCFRNPHFLKFKNGVYYKP